MIMIIVISMLIVMSSHTFVVFCAKTKKEKKDNLLAVTPQANTPNKIGKKPSVIVEREDRDSTRTKAGNRHLKDSKEPDSTDDAFKDLAARLQKKEKQDKTNDSLLVNDDENPLVQLQMPERPVVDLKQDGIKLDNIVQMEKKPTSKQPNNKAPTPTTGPMTAKDVSISNQIEEGEKKSKKSQKGATVTGKSKLESPIKTDKTQSDPRIDPTQIATLEEDATKKEKEKKKEDGSQKKTSGSAKKLNKDPSVKSKGIVKLDTLPFLPDGNQ
ncbi:hypothetical protein CRE_03669 [Caenorhabditis remanei]|uniref:Uncharacterized protein n=1 Tax=Caenorhabditis remanei TaxID=31234 RepID=E3LXL2_CAERE|nr:hypothetical protein CRE_03669 [Caenorhabditis remanei]